MATRSADPGDVTVRRADILSAEALRLIDALNAELSKTYPEPGACHFRLDPDEVAPGQGAFVVAFQSDHPVGCGAVRKIDARTGELKRMYVRPESRGRGVGRRLVAALEAEARSLGLSRVVLETGIRQRQALALYERTGFARIPPFGEYVSSPVSICMAKDL
jgi:putative acetyltransferase